MLYIYVTKLIKLFKLRISKLTNLNIINNLFIYIYVIYN